MATSATRSLSSLGLLDEVQHLRELDALVPERFLAALAAELLPLAPDDRTLLGLEGQLDGLLQALGVIERFAEKAMGICLTHVMATQPVSRQIRSLVMATVTSYAADLGVLRARLGGALPAAALDAVLGDAERVLALRQVLRDGVFALTQQIAAAQLAWVKQAGRDRLLPDAERNGLRLASVDLALLRSEPHRITAARFTERLKRYELPPEEPEPETEANRFALLEID